MCSEHEANASDVLVDWLETHRIIFTVNMILLNHGNLGSDPFYDSIRDKVTQPSQVVAKSRISKQEREFLQSGESAMNMSDDKIYEFFSSDMRKIQGNAKVHKIPQGEPVFIFCVVQGLQNSIMAFIDSGANCFLSQEGIPENELISVKLQDGPIPLSVASGMTTYASPEYASLLPLANGNYQTVRGLTLRKVTGDMPELDLAYAFERIKTKCSSNKRIQNLKVPSIVGGQVQMILGIRYQTIYPEVLHSFPNGLTVFESKLRPAESNALACIGGPLSCIDSLCNSLGASTTMSYMANLTQNLGQYLKIDLFPSLYSSSYGEKEDFPDA